jgi:peptide/nickel transport system substrate-binding protein
VNRRQFLGLGARLGLGLMALPLAGCGGPNGPVSGVPDDTLAVAVSALQPTLDPHDWDTAVGPRTLAPMFDALTFIQNDGQLRPALAIGWTREEPTLWQFRLRVGDAKFHNGETFGPDSVQATFDRLLQAGSTLGVSRLLANVDRLEVANPWTVTISTKQPDDDLPRKLSLVYMLPPEYFGREGVAGFRQQPIGTGYWMFDALDAGRSLRLTLFRDTWRAARGSDPPPLKHLRLQVVADAAGRAAALRGLQLDVATELEAAAAAELSASGFRVQREDVGQANATNASWQAAAFGAPLTTGTDVLATAANVQGIASEPSGAWWFDRVTKTELQRVAVMGGA